MLVSCEPELLIGRWLNTSLKIKPNDLVLYRREVFFYTKSSLKYMEIELPFLNDWPIQLGLKQALGG